MAEVSHSPDTPSKLTDNGVSRRQKIPTPDQTPSGSITAPRIAARRVSGRARHQVKQRVAREGQGRSGGYRMLVAYRASTRAVFLYAFAKNERENIGPDELLTWREIGAGWLAADAQQIAHALAEGILQEVSDGENNQT